MPANILHSGRAETLRYHTDLYRRHSLFSPGSWLQMPAPFVMGATEFLAPRKAIRVLDLGAGIGRHAIPIARILPRAQVFGVDLLSDAVKRLQVNAGKASLNDRVHGLVGDLEHLPLAHEHFDLVIACSALEHVSDMVALQSTLQRLQRHTQPGGIHCFVIGTNRRERAGERYRAALVEFPLRYVETKTLIEMEYQDWDILELSPRFAGVDEQRGAERYRLERTCLQLMARKTRAASTQFIPAKPHPQQQRQ